MTDKAKAHARAAITTLAPLTLLAAFVWHPHLTGRLPNESAIADAVAADPTRWGFAHLMTAVASGVVVIAFIAVRGFLRERGDESWSALGLPLIVIGGMLYALLPGMEFAPLAAIESGGDAGAAQGALQPWFLPVLLLGALSFGLGVLGFAMGIARLRIFSPGLTGLVVVALVVFAASRFVPLFAVQGYVQAAAALAALWPLALRMWNVSAAPLGGAARPSTTPA